jgi:hypothetical protein
VDQIWEKAWILLVAVAENLVFEMPKNGKLAAHCFAEKITFL